MAIKAILDSIVIVGGGTAGWLTAANLAKSLNCDKNNAIKITLIESPNIPTIGVGEGTWPTMRKTLAKIGIDESEFIKSAGHHLSKLQNSSIGKATHLMAKITIIIIYFLLFMIPQILIYHLIGSWVMPVMTHSLMPMQSVHKRYVAN